MNTLPQWPIAALVIFALIPSTACLIKHLSAADYFGQIYRQLKSQALSAQAEPSAFLVEKTTEPPEASEVLEVYALYRKACSNLLQILLFIWTPSLFSLFAYCRFGQLSLIPAGAICGLCAGCLGYWACTRVYSAKAARG